MSVALIGLAGMAPGCAHHHQDEAPAAVAEARFCDALCSYAWDCGSYVQDCSAACPETNQAYFARVQPAFLEAYAACLGEAACVSDVETVLSSCAEVASHAMAPTVAAYDLCGTLAQPLFDCGYPAGDACVETFMPFSDGLLGNVAACPTTDCASFATCLDGALS